MPPDPAPRPLDEIVEAFEAALARGGEADLRTFLPPAAHPEYDAVLAELIRVDLEHGWGRDCPRPLSEYRDRFPDFFRDPEHARAVAFEEYRLRRQAGQDPSPDEYERRYGIRTAGWPPPRGSSTQAGQGDSLLLVEAAHSYRELRLLRDTESLNLDGWCRSHAGSVAHARLFRDLHLTDPEAAGRLADGLTSLPEVGAEFLGFHLVAELGRGAFGRVFLARQEALAGRLVALKVAPDVGGESQTLAQLQHTHIVPIYSLHRDGALQAVCMPYFGALTLADVLRDLIARPTLPLSGPELLSTLNARHSDPRLPSSISSVPVLAVAPTKGEAPRPVPLPALKNLEGKSYVEAVLWLGCCLADGLAHAHERGILHRDLKPANVLLTDDGLPMLLDFNLSEDTKLRDSAAAAMMGGTLPYMAPEHLEAFRGGRCPVDARSDIFSLGILLFELLTGRPPYPSVPAAAGKQGDSSTVDMDAVVRRMVNERCVPPPPVRRWNRDASPAVAAILCRCLDPDPARRYQTARQLQEDLQCQLDSLPLRHAAEPSLRERVRKQLRRSPRLPYRIAIAGALLLVAVAAVFGLRAHREKQREQAHNVHLTRVQEARANWREFQTEVIAAKFILNTQRDPARLADGAERCRKALAEYGVLDGADWRDGLLYAYLGADQCRQLEEEIGELLLLLARSLVREGPTGVSGLPELRTALEYNRQAERCFEASTPPPALWDQRADLLERLGETAEAEPFRDRARSQPLRTARDHYLHAREHTVVGRYREALPLLLKATDLDPRNYWAWFLLGICFDGLEDDTRAADSYNACVALAPDFHGAYFNRGLARLRHKDYPRALADFGKAIELHPGYQDSHVNRALALQGLGRHSEAVADLTHALKLDDSVTRLYFMRARARARAGDKRGADEDFAEGLRREPRDAMSWSARGSARLARKDYAGALKDFDHALVLNPTYRPALNNKVHVLSEKLNRPKDALPVLDEVIRLYPDYVPARAGRGVLHARLGDRDAALADARVARARDRSPPLTYQVGCVYALTSCQHPADADQALWLLKDALRRGFGADLLAIDPDLKPLHHLPAFKKLLTTAEGLKVSRQ